MSRWLFILLLLSACSSSSTPSYYQKREYIERKEGDAPYALPPPRPRPPLIYPWEKS